MAASARTRPEQVIDKNGKVTTVHKLAEDAAKGKSRVKSLGHFSEYTTNDGKVKKTLRLSPTETATLMRESLKDAFKKDFPNTKFYVNTNKYSGGSSINVRYSDGPHSSDVEHVAKAYAGATFNGMIDLKEYVEGETVDGVSVSYGADFVFVNRELSPEAEQSAKAELEQMMGGKTDEHRYIEMPSGIRDMIPEGDSVHWEAPAYSFVHIIAAYRANEHVK
jgi:hypothetical protein